jgi:hypothetical protein
MIREGLEANQRKFDRMGEALLNLGKDFQNMRRQFFKRLRRKQLTTRAN